MRRTAMLRHAKQARPPEEGGDEAYLDFVRSLPCCACGKNAPSHAHHETGGGRGKGQKAPDNRTMPLCFQCHREFHSVSGRFDGFTFDGKRMWQEMEIERVQELRGQLLDTFAASQDTTGLVELRHSDQDYAWPIT